MKLFKRIHYHVFLFLTLLVFFSCRKENSHSPATVTTAVSKKNVKMVPTPYGMMPDTAVIIVEKGQEIQVKNGRALIVNSVSRAVVKDVGAYVTPDNNSTSQLKTLSLRKIASDLATTQSGQKGLGYQAQYFPPAGKTISYFSSDWKVPPGPALIDSSGAEQDLYFWNGLWDGGSTFMQPVYQYYQHGFTGAGNPEYCIRNWAIVNGAFVSTPPIDLPVGTKLTGYMELLSSTSSSYTYKIGFVGYPSIDLTFTVPNPADRLLQVYETYCGGPGYSYNTEYSTMNKNVLNYSGSNVNQPITWTINNDEAGNGYNITPSGRTAVPFNNGRINSYVNFYFDLGANILPGHIYKVVSAVDDGKVLEVKGGGTADGTVTVLHSRNSPITTNQEWLITLGVDGFYKLAPVNAPGKVLDVAGSGTVNGTPVDIYTDNGTNEQKWQIRPILGNYCNLFPASSPFSALDVNSESTANNVKVKIHSANNSNGQLFKFVLVK
jgi:hypothetical protein